METTRRIIETSAVMESINMLRADQDPCDRMKYNDIAIEAVLNPAGKSKMVQQLYTDIINHSNIDFGDIPKSNGDITKYKNYEQMFESITTLNALFGNHIPHEGEIMNKVHDFIITARRDFEYGFKFDVEIVKFMYNILVMSLHEIINVCILSYANYLKEVKNVDFTFVGKKTKNYMVVTYAESIVASYEKGEWNLMMKELRGDGKNLLGGLLRIAMTAPGANTIDNNNLKDAIGSFADTGGGKVVFAVVILVTVLVTIRGLVYLFYHSSAKFSNYLKNQAEFLKYNINKGSDPINSIESQKALLDNMDNLVTNIETKILKSEATAKKELIDSNRTNFSAKELSEMDSVIAIV